MHPHKLILIINRDIAAKKDSGEYILINKEKPIIITLDGESLEATNQLSNKILEDIKKCLQSLSKKEEKKKRCAAKKK